jgi:SAM-dependent methyltransferase
MSSDHYRDFYYPLNAFMHILTHEEGDVPYLHYGLFESAADSIAVAQERSTSMLLERLPKAPASILEVGIGLATTLARLTRDGYRAVGITPDEKQIAMVKERWGDRVDARCISFEAFPSDERFDCVVFQESSQYIDSAALWSRAAKLTSHVIVLDEFAIRPEESTGPLHPLERFVACAVAEGFAKVEEIDLSAKAAPTIGYVMERLPRYRDRLIADIGITSEQVDELIASGGAYRDLYASGVYGYRLLQFRRPK